LVLGGGLIGCETALWLAQQGKKATVVEILPALLSGGIPVQHMNRLMLLDLLRFHRVEVLTGASLLQISPEGAILQEGDSSKREVDADMIVLAVGLAPEQDLYRSLRGRIPNLFLIGDSRNAQNIMNAVWDAYEVARMV
jgi:2-enoate reductase